MITTNVNPRGADLLRALTHSLYVEETRMGDQQLVARIKRSSKYWGQTAPDRWFDVRIVDDASYRIRGNDNNYRLSDVALGMRLEDGSIVDLTSGRTSRS